MQKEHEEQKALINWCRMMEGFDYRFRMIYAVPNGARTSMSVARRLKAEGMKKGVPDLVLPVPSKLDNRLYHGLYIEFKKTKGRNPSPEQTQWLKDLAFYGYYAVCCKGVEAAKRMILTYLHREDLL